MRIRGKPWYWRLPSMIGTTGFLSALEGRCTAKHRCFSNGGHDKCWQGKAMAAGLIGLGPARSSQMRLRLSWRHELWLPLKRSKVRELGWAHGGESER
ncbi:hypothetical protein ACFX1S_034210 [Malus domestica]